MTPLIDMRHITKRYGQKTALNHVNIRIEAGKIIGLIGSNGSGKTTWLKLLAGLVQQTEGELYVDGKKIGKETKAVVSYLPDSPRFDDWMRVEDALRFYELFYPDFEMDAALAMLEEMKIGEKDKISSLSKGAKEKLYVIVTLARRAKLYLLDEPLGGIDLLAREQVLQMILNHYREDSTIIISTHLISEIERMFDEVIFLKNGNLVLHENAEQLRMEKGKAVNELFREVFE